MRNWKNWLFPILTVLTVAALVLLPLRLSALEDAALTGAVHAEDLSEDSNFPFKPPDLPGRIWLLVQYCEMPENLTVMSQELEGGDRERAMERLNAALAELGSLLSPETAAALREADGNSWDWFRYFLRDQKDLAGTSFIEASTYDKSRHITLNAVLDGESGEILSLVFRSHDGVFADASPRELGEAILRRLDLEFVPGEDVGDSSYFRLPECRSLFWIAMTPRELDFSFTLDWAAVDAGTAELYGHEPTDADVDSMQIR